MKVRAYFAIGLLSAFVFALVDLPASWMWRAFGGYVAPYIPAQVERVGGSLWQGFMVLRAYQWPDEPTVVSWNLAGREFFVGSAASGLHVENKKMVLDTDISAGIAGYRLENTSAMFDLSLLQPILDAFGSRALGVIQLDNLAVHASRDLQFADAKGKIVWQGGAVSYGYGGAVENYAVPPVDGELSVRDGGLFLSVKASSSGKLLGEAGITGDGMASVMILQRVLALVGMPASDEDRVLLKTQQPLF